MKKNELKKIITSIFMKHGLSRSHANISTDALINAELVGAYGHGLSRLKMYCDRISKKVINPKPKIKIKKISQSISHIDANNSIGFVAADLGIKTAIKNAQKTGIGMVAVKNSGHYGLSGYYAEQAVKKNLIAMIYTNAPPAVAPHGALKTLFGTNPVCFGTPTGSKIPFILDEGVQLPIAGFRGSGLAWMVDILSGVLTGGNHAGRVKDPFDDFSGPQNIGHLFITFKANLFQKNYNQRIKDNIKTIKKLPKIKGVKEIMYPGQNKFNRYKQNLKKEISISDIIKKDLEALINK